MNKKNNNKSFSLLILGHNEKKLLQIANELMEVQRLDDLAEARKMRRKAKTGKNQP